ncbi:TOPRIM domain protein [Methanocaldococcus sp. FS406-22]|uniref:toprim domain-containing protein n=1 Tax=Methanocaldococcus sp. (strain FS406-22) TaxID=644281 RepID=UPI0001BF1087|nr:toprim domain-containing protein [Methanocaldococcus sp. FS406-22]ADC69339.1 TOPRIM domain protein [Methanocaldococcus sp. FS406-22]
MRRDEYFEKLLEVIEELKIEAEEKPIIVEGKRDVESLEKLGVEGTFIIIAKTPIYLIADELVRKRVKEVILLTDFDRRGRMLAKAIVEEFRHRGIKVNTKIRHEIFIYTNSGIRDIESLFSYVNKRMF